MTTIAKIDGPSRAQLDRVTEVADTICRDVLTAMAAAAMPRLGEQLVAFELGIANALVRLVEHMPDTDAAGIFPMMGNRIAETAREARFGAPS